MRVLDMQVIECLMGWQIEGELFGMTFYSKVHKTQELAKQAGDKFAKKVKREPSYEN